MRALREKLERLRSNSLRSGPTQEECDTMKRLSEILSREEAMMRQRSRIQWLREGDRNTAYFHAKARDRARTNNIKSLKMLMVRPSPPRPVLRIWLLTFILVCFMRRKIQTLRLLRSLWSGRLPMR